MPRGRYPRELPSRATDTRGHGQSFDRLQRMNLVVYVCRGKSTLLSPKRPEESKGDEAYAHNCDEQSDRIGAYRASACSSNEVWTRSGAEPERKHHAQQRDKYCCDEPAGSNSAPGFHGPSFARRERARRG